MASRITVDYTACQLCDVLLSHVFVSLVELVSFLGRKGKLEKTCRTFGGKTRAAAAGT